MTRRRYATFPPHADAPLLALLGAVIGWGVTVCAVVLYALLHRSTNYGNH